MSYRGYNVEEVLADMMLLFALGFLVAVPAGIVWGIAELATSKRVTCPVCGRKFPLIGKSARCPKCKTWVVAKDGRIVADWERY